MQGRSDCYCAKSTERDAAKLFQKWAPEDCNRSCTGDGSEACGSGGSDGIGDRLRISIYRQGTAQQPAPPANPKNPDVTVKNVKYAFDGCYASNLFSFFTFTFAFDGKNSNERCVASCASRGFTYAATTR